MQPESSLQVVAQTLPTHSNGVHAVVAAGMQVPAPLQAPPDWIPAEQTVVPQAMPPGYSEQVPAPLQAPLVAQEAGPKSVQSLSGSAPPAIAPQLPSTPPPFLEALQA